MASSSSAASCRFGSPNADGKNSDLERCEIEGSWKAISATRRAALTRQSAISGP